MQWIMNLPPTSLNAITVSKSSMQEQQSGASSCTIRELCYRLVQLFGLCMQSVRLLGRLLLLLNAAGWRGSSSSGPASTGNNAYHTRLDPNVLTGLTNI